MARLLEKYEDKFRRTLPNSPESVFFLRLSKIIANLPILFFCSIKKNTFYSLNCHFFIFQSFLCYLLFKSSSFWSIITNMKKLLLFKSSRYFVWVFWCLFPFFFTDLFTYFCSYSHHLLPFIFSLRETQAN